MFAFVFSDLKVIYLSISCCFISCFEAFPGGAVIKEPACQCRRLKRCWFNPWVGKLPWRRAWQSTPIFLPGKFHEQGILADYSPWNFRVRHICAHARARTHTHTHTHTHICCPYTFKMTLKTVIFLYQIKNGKQSSESSYEM